MQIIVTFCLLQSVGRIINFLFCFTAWVLCSVCIYYLRMEVEQTSESLDPYNLNGFLKLLYRLKTQETFYESICQESLKILFELPNCYKTDHRHQMPKKKSGHVMNVDADHQKLGRPPQRGVKGIQLPSFQGWGHYCIKQYSVSVCARIHRRRKIEMVGRFA